MKIRADFVTNSSSVSFVLTMSPEMVKVHASGWGDYKPNAACVVQKLKERMEKDGTRVMLEDHEIYSLKVTFGTDEIMDDQAYGKPHDDIDLLAMTDEQVWAYVYGEYILGGRIAGLRGFGSTQVETY